MIKTLRDAEIQIEELRDKIQKLKTTTASNLDTSEVNRLIGIALNRTKTPPIIVADPTNIFEELFLIRTVSGKLQPTLSIDSNNTTISRIGRVNNMNRLDLSVNQVYNGSTWEQDDATVGSLMARLFVDTTDATCNFEVSRISAGTTTKTNLFYISGDGTVYPGTGSTYSLGKSTARWDKLYAEAIDLVSAVLVEDGGTGRTSLTANNVLMGNGTGNVNLVAGSNTNVQVVTDESISYSTGSHEGITYVTDVTLTQTKTTLNFNYGVFTGTS